MKSVLPNLATIFGQKILILVPHPDDEVVACCATLGRAQQLGAEIYAVYLSHGCVAKDKLWPWKCLQHNGYVRKRLEEAENVSRTLGITPLGWNEKRASRQIWRQMGAVQQEIDNILMYHRMDQIWLPAYEGGNPDHDALNAIGSRLAARGYNVLEFAEYNWLGGKLNRNSFPYPTDDIVTIELTDEEKALKKSCLEAYASEKQNLNYVGLEREAFRPLHVYDYTKPPHPGIMWYSRFQWVPFPHPSVNLVTPQRVCAAIKRWQGRNGAHLTPTTAKPVNNPVT